MSLTPLTDEIELQEAGASSETVQIAFNRPGISEALKSPPKKP